MSSVLNGLTVGDSGNFTGTNITGGFYTDPNTTAWDVWQGWYYPQVIRESYPVYVQERSKDHGKQAFEIIKALQDKKLMKLEKVSDFIEAMDTIIKTL